MKAYLPFVGREELLLHICRNDRLLDLVAEAQAHGISPRTAFRWNEKWLREGLIEKAEYGVYQKVG